MVLRKTLVKDARLKTQEIADLRRQLQFPENQQPLEHEAQHCKHTTAKATSLPLCIRGVLVLTAGTNTNQSWFILIFLCHFRLCV
jgi:hypothetical protein